MIKEQNVSTAIKSTLAILLGVVLWFHQRLVKILHLSQTKLNSVLIESPEERVIVL